MPISAHVIVNLSNKGPKGHITVRLVGNILYLINVGCTIGPVYSAYVTIGLHATIAICEEAAISLHIICGLN